MTVPQNNPSERIIPGWTLGDRMKKALSVSGIGVGEMADYLEVTPQTIGRWTTDRGPVKRSTLILWSMKTGVDLDWLENGETPAAGATGVSEVVRHQGLEPRTRWFTATGVALELVTEVAA